jgi:hypothetical protein
MVGTINKTEVQKDLYKSRANAAFSHYVGGNLYYNVEALGAVYQFPISSIEDTQIEVDIPETWKKMFTTEKLMVDTIKLAEDLGVTKFNNEIKGSDLYRWISRAIDNNEFIQIS